MTRGRAVALALVVALAALSALAAASLDQARGRAAATSGAATSGAAPLAFATARAGEPLCVDGAGAAAAAAATARPSILRDGRVDSAALAAVSALAFALERTVERHGASIPQRVGLDPAGAAVTPATTCQPLARAP